MEIEGPEYETAYAMGGLNCLESLEEVAYLNDVCDRLGLDTMSAGNMTGFVTEASKRGKIDFPINCNQPDRITETTRSYYLREDIDSGRDTFPPYLLDNPTREGASISRTELRTLIEEYNQIRRNRNGTAETAETAD